MKTYRKDGNRTLNKATYCREHFIEKYGREPNILDTAHLRSCNNINHCEICDGILKLTAKYREDNQGVEEWTCQNCGAINNRR